MPLSAHEFERRLIFYASPTLTKLKVACMYNLNDLDDLEECIDYYNEILNKKGIYLKVLSIKGRSMIYVYQKEKLDKFTKESFIVPVLEKTGAFIMNDKLIKKVVQETGENLMMDTNATILNEGE